LKGATRKKGNFCHATAVIKKRRCIKKGQAGNGAQRLLTVTPPQTPQTAFRKISEIRFSEFAESWLKSYAEIHVKQSTLARYGDIIRRIFLPALGGMRLCRLSALHIQALVVERLKEVSPKTVWNETGLIKQMMSYARRWGYIQTDPSEPVKRPRVNRAEIEILNPEEIGRMLAKIDRRYRLALLTCVLTGLRAGELWALQWPDIDFETFQIHVRRSLWRGRFQTPKSRSSVRRIDIPERLANELKNWKLSSPPNELDLVFPNTVGKPMAHDNMVKRHFEPALKRADLRHVSFHSLRHANATLRIASKQNLKYIQGQLGHSSLIITLDTYGHFFTDANFNREQVRLLETSLGVTDNPGEKYPLLIASGGSS